jgi:hypothetical protein
VLTIQSRNQFVLPPMSRERVLQVLVGEDRKSRLSDYFSVLASSSCHRFDLVLHMMLFPYCMCLIIIIKIKINLGSVCRIFIFLGISDIASVFT